MLLFPLKNEVENISWLCPLQRLATAPPAREPLAPGWWAWLKELLSFDNIWDSFPVVAPRVLPLSWAKSISELRWSSYLTNTEGTPAAHPRSLKGPCQNSLLLSHKIKYSFRFRVRIKSKRTFYSFTVWCDNDPCLQLYPYRDTEERHHREATSPSAKDTYLSSIHKKYQLVRVRNGRHRADGKTKRRKNEVNAPLASVSIYHGYTRAGTWELTSPGEVKASGTTQHWWDL